jgi:hypothetical protein
MPSMSPLFRTALVALIAAGALTACDRAPGAKGKGSATTAIGKAEGVPQEVGGIEGATPMDRRVAVLGLLNKRNNLSQEIKLKPGEAREIGPVIIRLSSCERTAPWELPQETGAFVQVDIRERGEAQHKRVFSGWLFKESPSLNVVEHPVYDVWVKDCTMRFPGEEGSAAPSASPSGAATPRPSPTPTAASVPAPAATPDA